MVQCQLYDISGFEGLEILNVRTGSICTKEGTETSSLGTQEA